MERYTNLVQNSDHKQRIQNICERLRPPDVEKLHFICVKTIPEGYFHKLEGFVLERVDEMRAIEWVIEALIRIGRKDLLHEIPGDHRAALTKYSSLSNTNYDRLRIALLYIANNLTDTEDLYHLTQILKGLIKDNRRLQSVRTVLELFDLLTMEDIVNSSRPDSLLCVFRRYVEKPWFRKVQYEYVDVAKRILPGERRRDFLTEGYADRPSGVATKFEGPADKGKDTLLADTLAVKGPADKGKDTLLADTLAVKEETIKMKHKLKLRKEHSMSLQALKDSTFNLSATLTPPTRLSDIIREDMHSTKTGPADKGKDTLLADTLAVKVLTHFSREIAKEVQHSTKTEHGNKTNDNDAQKNATSISFEEDAKRRPNQTEPANESNGNGAQENVPSMLEHGNKTNDNDAQKNAPSISFEEDAKRRPHQTEPGNESKDNGTQENIPSMSEHGNKTNDNDAQKNAPSISFEEDAKRRPHQTEHGNKTNDNDAQKNAPSIFFEEDANPRPHQTEPNNESNDNGAQENDPSMLAMHNSKTQVIDGDDGTWYINSFSQNENEETSQTSTLAVMNAKTNNGIPTYHPARAISSPSQAEYPMTRNPRGWAVIFNIENFTKVPNDPTSTELDNRHGSSRDAESLESAFERLHFDVERHNNNTLTDIIAITDGYAARDHSSRDCFVFCILTHGSEGKLFDAHGHPFQFEQIFQKFSADKCPTLSGKPKVFFLQACQGNQPGVGRNLQADTIGMEPRLAVSYLDEGHSPNEADFLVFFPSRLGLPAFRDDNRGSWFIQSLVKHLNENAESHSLTDIFTDVINEVSSNFVTDRDTGRRYYQTPKFDSSLRKKLFFRSLRVT